MGEGRERDPFIISGSHSPAFSHLHPSLSLSVHLSLCLLPPLAVNLYPPTPLSVSSFLGRAPGPPPPPTPFWHPGSPLAGSRSRESGQSGTRICRGLGGGGEQVLERGQPAGCESEQTAPALPPAIAEAHTSNLPPLPALGAAERLRPRPLGSCLSLAIFPVPLQPASLRARSLCVSLSLLPLCFAVIKARILDEAATSVCALARAPTQAPACQLFPRRAGPGGRCGYHS